MSPRKDLDAPIPASHAFQVSVKAYAVIKPGTISGKQNRYSGVAVVIERIAQHHGLQGLVYALFSAL